MGRRLHGFNCHDCKDEHGWGHPQDDGPPAWVEKMEWMDKDELLEHIESIECPYCGSDDWEITDYSAI